MGVLKSIGKENFDMPTLIFCGLPTLNFSALDSAVSTLDLRDFLLFFI